MHGLPDQSEFQHRAIVLDKPRVGGAAAGRQFGLSSGDLRDCAGHEIGEWPRPGEKNIGIRGLPLDPKAHMVSGGGSCAFLDQRLHRSLAVAIVVTDIKTRTRLAGNEIDDGVLRIDRGEFEV